ncbi:MAG: hypothetical protein K8L97_22365 [Anaerolineae bacterium]|nr:hypothetical protein [Anaerolineae bacterium]
METLNGLPVLLARNTSMVYCETEACPYCGLRHKHGRNEIGTISHKVAHCPPFKAVSKYSFPAVWRYLQANPDLAETLKDNPGYYVKIIG